MVCHRRLDMESLASISLRITCLIYLSHVWFNVKKMVGSEKARKAAARIPDMEEKERTLLKLYMTPSSIDICWDGPILVEVAE